MKEDEIRVGIINSDPDMCEMMVFVIENLGFLTASNNLDEFIEHPFRYRQFIEQYDPRVLVMRIPMPYEKICEGVGRLMDFKESRGRGFVLTTDKKERVENLSKKTPMLEIVGEPFNIDEFEQAVIRSYQSHPPPYGKAAAAMN